MNDHQQVMAWYQETLGYPIPYGAREGKAVKWLLSNEYTLEDIQGCYHHLKEQHFWADKHLSLVKIQQEIGAWQQWAKKQAPKASPLEEYRSIRGHLPWETLDRATGEIS